MLPAADLRQAEEPGEGIGISVLDRLQNLETRQEGGDLWSGGIHAMGILRDSMQQHQVLAVLHSTQLFDYSDIADGAGKCR